MKSGRRADSQDPAARERALDPVASEQADYLVGSMIFVDGGMTLYPRFA